jgi:hypothetical protein
MGNWDVATLLHAAVSAWTWPNLPYTVAFWAIIGGIVWWLNRKRSPDDLD